MKQIACSFVILLGVLWMSFPKSLQAQTPSSPCPEVLIEQKYDHIVSPQYRAMGWDTVVDNNNPIIKLSAEPYIPVQYFNGTYTVEEIPYNPADTSFSQGTKMPTTYDDKFTATPTIIPFPFYFFGIRKNQFRVGDNGLVTFTTSEMANPFCPYQVNNPIPWTPGSGTTPGSDNYFDRTHDAIYGVYEDTYTGPGGSYLSGGQGIYYGILDEFPCRKIICSWNQVPVYSDASKRQSYQIVCYEGSNIIEVHVKQRCAKPSTCYGLIGIQNATGLPQVHGNPGESNMYVEDGSPASFAAPGWNLQLATSGIINNVAYRFTPQGSTVKHCKWFRIFDDGRDSVVLGTDQNDTNGYYVPMSDNGDHPTLTQAWVRPTVPSRYVMELLFRNANNDSYLLRDTITVGVITNTSSDACPGWNNPTDFTTGDDLYYFSGQSGTTTGAVPTGINFTDTYTGSQLATVTCSHSGDCGDGNYPDNAYVIMSASDGTDPNTDNNLPVVPSQFNTTGQEINTNLIRSIRVGNLCAGGGAHALYYTMRVTGENALVSLYYALVCEAPGHGVTGDSRFIYRITRNNGTSWMPVSTLPSLYLSLTLPNYGGSLVVGEDGWHSMGTGYTALYYKDWTKVNFDLTDYIGEDVRIEVMVTDCLYNAHYAYAYIAGECRPANMVTTVSVASNNNEYGTASGGGAYATGEEVTLTATPNCGYRFVRWKNANDETVSTDATYTFTANSNLAITAEFTNLWTAVCSTGQTLVYTIDCSTHTATLVGYTGTCSGNLVIPASVSFADVNYDITTIGDEAFYQCTELTSVTIPSSITTVGYDVFTGCTGLESANYTGTIAQWCNIEFHNSGSTSTNYSHSININGASVSELEVPFDVTQIGMYAFYNCTDLTSVNIPGTVTSIGMFAFYNCSGLTEIYCLALVPPTLDIYAFEGVPTGIPVYVPCGKVADYQAAEGWNRFTNIQEVAGCSTTGTANVSVYADGNDIVVEGADGNTVTLYDNASNVLSTSTAPNGAPLRFEALANGNYFIKIGVLPVKMKVVISE